MKQPLEDLTVLDLSRVYAAPAGSMILADLGADVVRVESPDGTDSMRDWGPFINGESAYYFSANRNKRSITINLKSDKGRSLFLRLVEKADVVIENFKTGTLNKLGLSFNHLKEVNERIILCSVTGYGQTGPFSKEPGFDPVIQALSGLMDVTGQPGDEATKVGIPIADILTSKYVAISIMAALRMRDANGVGQHIDLSLLDVQISSMANISSGYLNTGMLSKRMGNQHNNVVPYQVFQCADQPLMLCVGNDRLFKHLCNLVNQPEWAEDERYRTNDSRLKNKAELVAKIATIMRTKDADRWLALFSEYGIPAGKVNTIHQAIEHPQVVARNTVERLEHPLAGEVKMTRSPLRHSGLNITSKYAPPLLGEHTEEILAAQLGMSQKELNELKQDGVI
ncbi:CoA transferase [Bacillus sp. CRN 9]|nr:CoA transferase [Bacillus sp. CRN 9]